MIGFFPKRYPDELLYSQLCRYHRKSGYPAFLNSCDDLYKHRIYASTKDILDEAIKNLHLTEVEHSEVHTVSGEILKLNPDGTTERDEFDDIELYGYPGYLYGDYDGYGYYGCYGGDYGAEATRWYVNDLKSIASAYGYDPSEVDRLLEYGYSLEEIEDALYSSIEGVPSVLDDEEGGEA